MLPSLVVKIEQHWGLQQIAVELFRQGPFFPELFSEPDSRIPNRQVLDSSSERVSAGCDSQNARRPIKKNEAFWQSGRPLLTGSGAKTEVIENK